MSDTIRNKIIKRNLQIIDDPKSDARAIGIATKNLININKQNIDLDTETPKQNNEVIIKIEEHEHND